MTWNSEQIAFGVGIRGELELELDNTEEEEDGGRIEPPAEEAEEPMPSTQEKENPGGEWRSVGVSAQSTESGEGEMRGRRLRQVCYVGMVGCYSIVVCPVSPVSPPLVVVVVG